MHAQFRAHRQEDEQHQQGDAAANGEDFENAQAALASSRIDTAMTENDSNVPTIQRTTRASLLMATAWFAKR